MPVNIRNSYLIISFLLLILFIVLSLIVSPKVNLNSYSSPLAIVKDTDISAYIQINHSHYKPLDQLMVLFTEYGREVIWSLTGVLLVIFGESIGLRTAVVMGLAMVVLIPIGTAAKDLVGRPRPIIPPDHFLIAADTDFSYPSGHAMIVSAGSAVMLALFRDSHRRLAISIGLTIEAALVCFSRVYVGGHYPLDVIGGILLGVAIAFVFVAKVKKIDQSLVLPIEKAFRR